MNDAQVITVYEDVLAVTEQMLQAARHGDWGQLVALEKRCKCLIENLMAAEPREPLSSPLQQRKIEIIKKVLADDARIRDITEPWMKRVHCILNTASHERKLQQAYEPGAGF